MKPSDQKSFIVVFAVAIVGFFLFNTFASSLAASSAVIFASGVVLGGLAAIFASPATKSDSVNNTDTKTKTLYVGNLPYKANEGVVRQLFAEQGQVFSVRLLKDKNTGKRRGFGFVEMAESDADKAIAALNDHEFQQRTLKVRAAKQKPAVTEAELAS